MTETDRLLRELARRVEADPEFMGGVLQKYRQNEQLTEEALAAQLGTNELGLSRLALCKRPDPDSPRFAQMIREIADYAGVDAAPLAQLLRQVDSLNALGHNPTVLTVKESADQTRRWSGVLAAARDRESEEELPTSDQSEDEPEGEADGDVAGSNEPGRD